MNASTAISTTTSTPDPSPPTMNPTASGWPVRTITSTGVDRDLAPTSHALYWMQDPDAPSAAPVTATPMRYDLVSGHVTSGATILGLVGSPALTVTGGWVWVVVGQGAASVAEQLDPATLALHATRVLMETAAPYPPSPLLAATVNGPLWVAAGENVWALSPTTGTIEATLTTAGAVASMSTDPSGRLLYLTSQPPGVEGGEVVSQYDARDGRLLRTTTERGTVGPGTVAATTGGVWVSDRSGNAGGAYELSSDALTIASPTQPGFGTFYQTGGVGSGVSEDVLWLTTLTGVTCADPHHGTIRASATGDLEGPVASGHVLYAGAPAGGIVAITPPPACWDASGPGT